MSDLVPAGVANGDSREGRHLSAFRTLLAGGFAAADCRQRRLLEDLLASPTGQRLHHIKPGCRLGRDIDRAELELSGNSVDLVLIDLDGPVPALLDMVERLRASAYPGVVFVGILPAEGCAVDRLYLSSVMDAVVEGPLRPGTLHGAIADALYDAELQAPLVSQTRH